MMLTLEDLGALAYKPSDFEPCMTTMGIMEADAIRAAQKANEILLEKVGKLGSDFCAPRGTMGLQSVFLETPKRAHTFRSHDLPKTIRLSPWRKNRIRKV